MMTLLILLHALIVILLTRGKHSHYRIISLAECCFSEMALLQPYYVCLVQDGYHDHWDRTHDLPISRQAHLPHYTTDTVRTMW
jgi:hypothetical protein